MQGNSVPIGVSLTVTRHEKRARVQPEPYTLKPEALINGAYLEAHCVADSGLQLESHTLGGGCCRHTPGLRDPDAAAAVRQAAAGPEACLIQELGHLYTQRLEFPATMGCSVRPKASLVQELGHL